MKPFICRGKTYDNGNMIPDGIWVFGYYKEDLYDTEMKSVIFNCPVGFKIDPETRGQFTGLYDDTRWDDLTQDEQNRFLEQPYPEYNIIITPEDWKGKKYI